MSDTSPKSYYDKLIGKEIKGYSIEKKLGEGGMGAVFKASKLSDNANIAIKVISPMLLTNSRFVKRFQREAKVGKVLTHPNIIQVLEYGEAEDGMLFMAMEFVEGETLRAKLNKSGPLAPKETLEMLKQLCDAIDTAHKRGILHRDLKTENVMIAKDANGKDVVKLADFGLVKLMQPDGEITKGSALTEVGEIFGTPHFMAPEQVTGHPVEAPADIYALGVILYQMLTGKTPLEGADVKNLLIMKISQDAPPPSKKLPSLNQAYDNVFNKVLARSAEDRYKNAGEFYNAFKDIVNMVESGLFIPESQKVETTINKPLDGKRVEKSNNENMQITDSKSVTPVPKESSASLLVMAGGAILVIIIVIIVLFIK